MYQAMISEIAKNKLENFKPSFDEINKKMSPNELLKNSEKLGISGDKLEVDKIKKEIENASGQEKLEILFGNHTLNIFLKNTMKLEKHGEKY